MFDFHSEVTGMGDTVATLRTDYGVEYAAMFHDDDRVDSVLSVVLINRSFVRLDSMTKLEAEV